MVDRQTDYPTLPATYLLPTYRGKEEIEEVDEQNIDCHDTILLSELITSEYGVGGHDPSAARIPVSTRLVVVGGDGSPHRH